MQETHGMRIDAWTHVLSAPYLRRIEEAGSEAPGAPHFLFANRALYDLERRFEVMDAFADYRQIPAQQRRHG